MITSELARMVDTLHAEKNIPRDTVIEIVESAIVAAARKALGEKEIEAQYDPDSGDVDIYEYRTVVEEVEDDDLEIAIEDAQEHDPEVMIGDSLGFKVNVSVGDLGRIAAQTAKQVIIQKIRDAERELTFDEFKDRKGELITGIVRRFEKGNIVVDLGRTEAILPKREQVPTETYRQGDRIQAYVLDITRASKSPQVVLSRTHPGLLMKLFELEVPEIYEGIVRIEACAREPGHRAKIAVSSLDRDVDPVGACVGLKGSRVQAVVQELKGEAIDIIPFHPDPARFIVAAIAPANVSRVYIDEMTHSMELIVPDDQLSKAIGRRGQNVRLAAQLTGWRIDIYSESRHAEITAQAREELSRVAALDAESVELLIRHGFRSAQEVYDAEPYEIAQILDIEDEEAEEIINQAEKALDALILEEAARRRAARDTPRARPSASSTPTSAQAGGGVDDDDLEDDDEEIAPEFEDVYEDGQEEDEDEAPIEAPVEDEDEDVPPEA